MTIDHINNTKSDTGIREITPGDWNASHIVAVLDLVPQAADPGSLGDGNIWYNSVAGLFKFRQGGVTAFLGGGGGSGVWGSITGTLAAQTDLVAALAAKQDVLVSATNIKTVNGTSLVGAGNVTISVSAWGGITGTLTAQTDLTAYLSANYAALSHSHTAAQISDSTTAGRALLTAATVAAQKAALAIASGDVSGLGTLATQSGTFSGTHSGASSGTNTGDQTITLTGDVTGSGSGSFAATITAGAITLAKQANLAASSIVGNNTGSAATPIAMSAAQTKALLAIASSDVSGLGSLATASSVSLTTQATGTLQSAQAPAHTGDATSAAGSLALTLATVNANVGAFGSASAVATFTVDAKGRITAAGSTAISIASTALTDMTTAGRAMITAATATAQTALLDAVTSGAKGLAPASGGGTANFLRADGTWAAPAGGGGVSDGDKGDVVVSGSGAVWSLDYTAVNAVVAPVFANITGKPTTLAGYGITNGVTLTGAQTISGPKALSDNLDLTGMTPPAAPGAGVTSLFGITRAGRTFPAFMTQAGVAREIQTGLAYGTPMIWKAQAGGNAVSAFGGGAPTAVGTATGVGSSNSNKYGYYPKLEYLVTVAATTAIAGFYRGASTLLTVAVGGASAGLGGFRFVGQWGPATGVATTTNRAFFGLLNSTSLPTDVEPSSLLKGVWMGWDAADTNIQMMTNDGTGTATKTDLGASFPVPTTDRASLYELEMYSPPGTTQVVNWRVTDLISGAVASGSITTDLPATTDLLAPRGWVSVGGTSSVIGLTLVSLYLDPLL